VSAEDSDEDGEEEEEEDEETLSDKGSRSCAIPFPTDLVF
jgi:hypothetical protein